ncbi:MAG: 3-dehydroquinate synthase [Psychromonas sp.]|nr:3-dehydroquinate synthase [Psychromonas sp.]
MDKLAVQLGARSYPISIGENLLSSAKLFESAIVNKKVMIITNNVVAPLYLQQCEKTLQNFQVEHIILPDGEKYKTFKTFEAILNTLLKKKYARDTTIVALGGGVIGDIAGFVAACYQRGVAFIQVPTTVLAQVDSSVGGKTAVNHPLGKNMIGAFYQPQTVIIDINCLKTLPKREFVAGMAEVIKYGVIYDRNFFDWLNDNVDDIKALEADKITYMIKRCCAIKAEIVAQDEKEHGIRALLNLGHTFGHAIEAEQGYGNWLHGEAVAVGIVIAAKIALTKGLIEREEVEQIMLLIDQFNLPSAPPELMKYSHFAKHMQLDKKVLDGKIRLILPTSIGTGDIFSDTSEAAMQSVIGL